MKNKLKYLIGVSLKRKIKTKWFVIANIFLAIVLIGALNIDHIINLFGGNIDDITTIYVVDETGNSYEIFTNYLTSDFSLTGDDTYNVVLYEETKEQAIEMIQNDDHEKENIILVLEEDLENVLKATMITNDKTTITNLSIISNAVNQTKVVLAIEKYEISTEQIAGLTNQVILERQILNDENASQEENTELIMTTVFPILILPFFLLTIFLVQMIGAEVNDEKTTRGMEIIISNVSPKVHFFSKCIAGNLFVLMQGILLVLYVLLGLLVRTMIGGNNGITGQIFEMASSLFSVSFLKSLTYMLPLMLILMLITFVAYSLVAGILASMTTNAEDFQQLQSPIMIVMLIGYYLAIMAGMFDNPLFIKILGYVPFISAILSPSLFVTGAFSIIDIFISIALMLVTIYLLIKYGLRIYKVGILNYSSDKLWKKIGKALKSKEL